MTVVEGNPVNDSVEAILSDIFRSADFSAEEAELRDTTYKLSDLPEGTILGTAVLIENFSEKAKRVLTVLGSETTSLATGATAQGYVRLWAEGKDRPNVSTVRRVCIADVIVTRFSRWFPDTVSLETHSPEVESWMRDKNPSIMIDDEPAQIIATRPFASSAPLIAMALGNVIKQRSPDGRTSHPN